MNYDLLSMVLADDDDNDEGVQVVEAYVPSIADASSSQVAPAHALGASSTQVVPSSTAASHGGLQLVSTGVKRKRSYYTTYVDGKRRRTVNSDRVMSRSECCAAARLALCKQQKAAAEKIREVVEDSCNAVLANSRCGKMVVKQIKSIRTSFASIPRALEKLKDLSVMCITDRSSRVRMTANQITAVACDLGGDSTSRAASHKVSTRTESKCKHGYAYAFLVAQAFLLYCLGQYLRTNPPHWSTCSVMWDETGQNLKLYVLKLRRSINATMQVFVYKVVFSWGWKDGSRQFMECFIPPMLLSSVAADKLYDAQRTHPFTKMVNWFKLLLVEITVWLAFQFAAIDSASGNTKGLAYECHVRPKVLFTNTACKNHQNFLGHLDMCVAVFGCSLLTSIYNTAKFFNLGANRLRCAIIASKDFLRSRVDFVPGFPDPLDVKFGQEFVSYVRTWTSKTKKGLDGFITRRLEYYFSIVGGGYGTKRFIVFLQGKTLTEELIEYTCLELGRTTVDLSFKNNFPLASSGKWTRTSPAVQRLTIGFLNSHIDEFAKEALGNITYDTTKEGAFDDTFWEWNKVASKASKIAFTFMGDFSQRVAVILMLVCDEVFRYLTSVYMDLFSNWPVREAGKASPIQILASDARSPVYAALAHLSALMAGRSSRLILIWRYRGCRSAQEWRVQYPGDVEILIRCCMSATATIQRRQRDDFSRLQYQVFAMADPLMPVDLSRLIATRYANSNLFDLSAGSEQRYWQQHRDRAESEAASTQGIIEEIMIENILEDGMYLWEASWSVVSSVFAAESQHSRNRIFSKVDGQTRTAANVAAESTIQQLSLAAKRLTHKSATPSLIDETPKALPIQEDPQNCLDLLTFKIKQTPEKLHRYDWIREQAFTNPHFDAISTEAWKQWRLAWNSLSEERKSVYADMSEATSAVAAACNENEKTCEDTSIGEQIVLQSSDPESSKQNFQISWLLHSTPSFHRLCTGDFTKALDIAVADSKNFVPGTPCLDATMFSTIVLARPKQLPSALARALQSTGFECNKGLAHASECFISLCQQLPQRDEGSMPSGKKWKMYRPAGLDPADSTARMRDMYDRVLNTFSLIANVGGKPRGVAARDVYLCLKAPHLSDGQVDYLFLHMSDAKSKYADNEAQQSFVEYVECRRDYSMIPDGMGGHEFYGRVIMPRREDPIEKWSPRYWHPFGELLDPPMVSYSIDKLASHCARNYQTAQVFTLATDLYEVPSPHGFGRILKTVIGTWDIQPYVEVSALVNPYDLLVLSGVKSDDVFDAVEEADVPNAAGAKKNEDPLVVYLRELLEDVYFSDPAFLQAAAEDGQYNVMDEGKDLAEEEDAPDSNIPEEPYVPYQQFLQNNYLEQRIFGKRMDFYRLDAIDKRIGFIDVMDDGTVNLKATCECQGHQLKVEGKRAKQCVCWVQLKPTSVHTEDEVVRSLTTWLRDGCSHTRETHWDKGFDLKKSFGMAPKPRKD